MTAPTRRAVLAGAGAAMALPAAIAPADAAASPDAALVAAADEFVAVDRAWCAAMAKTYGLKFASPAYQAAQAAADAFRDGSRYTERMEAIADMPAATLAGIQAKARAVAAHYGEDPPEEAPLMWSLVQDVLALQRPV